MLLQRARERLLAVPGIQAVGMSGAPLLDPYTYWIDGSQVLTTDRGVVLPGARWTFAAVGPGFFEAVGMSVVDGPRLRRRRSSRRQLSSSTASLATFLFGETSAIGRRIRLNPRGPLQSIVGVVNDVKQTSPRERGMGVVYLPMRDFGQVILAVRTAGNPADAVPVVRHQLAALAGDLPIEKVRTIAEVLDEAIAQERLMSAIAARPERIGDRDRLCRAVRAALVRRRPADPRARHQAGARRDEQEGGDDGASRTVRRWSCRAWRLVCRSGSRQASRCRLSSSTCSPTTHGRSPRWRSCWRWSACWRRSSLLAPPRASIRLPSCATSERSSHSCRRAITGSTRIAR